MAVQQGYGKMAGTDALVFAYDTGDVVNSYKGEPTENLLNDTTEFDSWTKARNSGTTPTVTSNTSPNPLGIPNAPMADTLVIPDDGTYPRIQQYFTPTSTNQHTMSVWIRSLSGDCDCFLGIFRNSPWSLPGHTVVSVTSEWQRFSFTMTPPDTTTHVAYIGSHDAAAQKGNTLELWGAMIEENSHKTPFTAGTRSATEGLLDLTGTTSIDLSNVSFDSDAMFQLDGTDDRIIFPPGSLPTIGTNDFTLEFVCKNTRTDRYNHFFSVLDQYHISFKSYNGDGLLYVYRTSQLSTTSSIPAYIPSRNDYYHIVAKRQGDNMQIYINGESQGLKTGWGDVSIDNNLYNSYIGWGAGTEYSGGHYAIAKIYNKALTDAEVSANFNNYKTRFNIA